VIWKDNGILLLHNAKRGWYELPGGKIEQGETPEEAALRELKEEIQCDVEIIGSLGVKHFEQETKHMAYHWFVAKIKEGQTPKIIETDHFDHWKYIDVKKLFQYPLSSNMKNFLKDELVHTKFLK
ncbi:MAG TPA: NUDIX hydrolase, partial [Candidatus Kapabacteria bacterium]|nr:NUDIX hydrolase [Candidatus Kapabacteria bacterium]